MLICWLLHCEGSKGILRLLGSQQSNVLGTAGEKEGRPASPRWKKPGAHPCYSSISSVTHPFPGYPCSVLWEEGLASVLHVGTRPSPEGRDMNFWISNQDSKGTVLALPVLPSPGLRHAVGLGLIILCLCGTVFIPATHKLCSGT